MTCLDVMLPIILLIQMFAGFWIASSLVWKTFTMFLKARISNSESRTVGTHSFRSFLLQLGEEHLKETKRVVDCIRYLHNPIMQYCLGGSLYKNNISCLLLGLYHASVNWIFIVLMQVTPPPPQKKILLCGIVQIVTLFSLTGTSLLSIVNKLK